MVILELTVLRMDFDFGPIYSSVDAFCHEKTLKN